jgi:hypothetical protein
MSATPRLNETKCKKLQNAQAGAQEEITPAAPAQESTMDLESMSEEEYMEWKLKVFFVFLQMLFALKCI